MGPACYYPQLWYSVESGMRRICYGLKEEHMETMYQSLEELLKKLIRIWLSRHIKEEKLRTTLNSFEHI